MIAMMTSLVAALASYAVLVLAISQGRQGRFFRTKTMTRYLAEAGMVIGKERLDQDPTWCGGTEQVDANGSGTLEAWETVTISVEPCPRAADEPATIRVSVVH